MPWDATLNARWISWPQYIKRRAKICSDMLPWVCCLTHPFLFLKQLHPSTAPTSAKSQIVLIVSCWNQGLIYIAKYLKHRLLLKGQKPEQNSVHIDKVSKEKITSDLIFFAIYVHLRVYIICNLHLTISGEWIGHEAATDFSGNKYQNLIDPRGKYQPKLRWVQYLPYGIIIHQKKNPKSRYVP